MAKKQIKKSKLPDKVEQTLDLVRDHLVDVIHHPEKLDQIPNNATVVLIPVPVRSKKAA